MKIVLIGFMGAGKSTVAKKLGHVLTWPVLEMDALVLQKTNMSTMHEVFAKGGEGLLRETEMRIAKEHALTSHVIVSTGAGVVMNKITVEHLKKPNGKTIFLNASFQTITARLANDNTRPLLKDAESLYQYRLPLYWKYADLVVEVDKKSTEEIANEITLSGLFNSF